MTETEEAVFQRAFYAHKNGRYQEVVDLLEGVSATAFERDQWAVLNCNILVCKMEKLRNTSELAEVLEGYREVWQRMKGLPPCVKSLPTELATCHNACQIMYCLWQGGRAMHCVKEGIALTHEAITRACQCCSVDTDNKGISGALVQLAARLSQSCDPDDKAVGVENIAPPFAVQCLVKLALLRSIFLVAEEHNDEASAIHQSITTILGWPGDPQKGELVDPFSSTMRASLLVERFVQMNRSEGDPHSEGDPRLQPQEAYLEAWQAYQGSRYQDALAALQGVCDCANVPLVAMGRLLTGCCYMRQNKLQLALCSFQHCLRSPSCLLPALHNCAQVFRLLSNEEAEFGIRRLLMEALESSRDPGAGGRGGGGWEGEDWRACPPQSLSLYLLHVQYNTALRALQSQRYRTAALVLKCIIETMRQGIEPLPRHLPPPTKLHLLLAHSLLLCGEYLECITVSDQLLSALDPAVDAGQVTLEAGLPIPSVVSMVTWLQGLFIRGSALQCEGRPGDGQQCYQRILKITNVLLPLLLSSPEQHQVALQQTEHLKVSTLNNLAVVTAAKAEHSQSFALIVQALACPRGMCGTTVGNYVQLLLRQGKRGEAYRAWLQYRGKVPGSGCGGADMLEAARGACGHSDEKELDVEALTFWVRQEGGAK